MDRRIATIIVIVALIIFAGVLYNAVFYSPADEISFTEPLLPSPPEEIREGEAYPALLSIPKIHVRANVQKVGLTQKGNMAAPSGFEEVGWYKYGAKPGEEGSAVIAGHVNNGLGLPAVFGELKNLEKGDEILITTEGNQTFRYIVEGSKVYDYDESVPEVFSQKNEKYLKLITCTGAWNQEIRTHQKRLVVTAVLASQ